MANVLMIRATVKPEYVEELKQAAGVMFDAIHAASPGDVRYASLENTADGSFVILLSLENGPENPLGEISEFQAFQGNLKNWLSGPPAADHFHPIGSYRLF